MFPQASDADAYFLLVPVRISREKSFISLFPSSCKRKRAIFFLNKRLTSGLTLNDRVKECVWIWTAAFIGRVKERNDEVQASVPRIALAIWQRFSKTLSLARLCSVSLYQSGSARSESIGVGRHLASGEAARND